VAPKPPESLRIRPFVERDSEALLGVSLRAWEPVLASIEQAFGRELHRLLTPDWRADKRQEIASFTGSDRFRVWVAELHGTTTGFVAVELDEDTRVGEIYLLAVDPDHQRQGLGTALTEFALESMKRAGMGVAVVETGFDPGHAAARRTYEKAGCVLIPAARYFKKL
jgi:ribosomal protein S18 acetylase RimI-like enzyme